ARWNKTTDKQRDLLGLLASRGPKAAREFTAQEVVSLAKDSELSNANASQLLHALCERGLIYRTRRGCFAFTVPMSESMILRRLQSSDQIADSWLAASAQSVVPGERKKSKGWLWFRS